MVKPADKFRDNYLKVVGWRDMYALECEDSADIVEEITRSPDWAEEHNDG